ncbi:MAG: transaldolase [Ignavibacteriales bacterium]|nr:MAG: transaldolase [Ignavibacteriales bacterium]
MTKLNELAQIGQSVWLDFISRKLLTSGELKELILRGLRGMTSNPTIFDKAISQSNDYDEEIKKLISKKLSIEDVYEQLAISDISVAADEMRTVYDSTKGLDGYVSLEVNPFLANNTRDTIDQALRLYKTLNRPNIMIKIPGTPEGIPAITEVIASGVNVNVTLIFSVENYRNVVEAFISGLEKLDAAGGDVSKIASVASFFVSRVDTAADKELELKKNKELIGKVAIANSKIAFDYSQLIYSSPRWKKLADKGARVQRLLWASTSTKNPNYKDTIYVDELIGPDTVNTMPPATIDSFVDHGIVKETLSQGIPEAKQQIKKLSDLGISLDAITEKLQVDGVKSFSESFTSLLSSLESKVKKLKEEVGV